MATQTASLAPAASNRGQFRALLAAPTTPYYLILATVAFLVSLGTLMVLSASSVVAEYWDLGPYYFAIRQSAILVVALVAAGVISRLPIKALLPLGWLSWLAAAVLLILTLFIGVERGGNKNWLNLGFIFVQPSELAKLALILFAAAVLHRKERRLREPLHLIVPLVPMAAVLFILILAGRDVGTGIIMGVIAALIMWFIGTPMRIMAPFAALAGGLVVILVAGSQNRSNRIGIFLDPESNPDLSAQPMSALYGLASGGIWGVGLGASRQKWGGLQTGPHTDFIFAVIGEELGLFGSLAVIIAFGVFACAGFMIARRSKTVFSRVASASITGWILCQAVINIFVVLNLLPVLGVPLPFMSYGGSSLLSCLIGVGVLLACARQTPDMVRYREAKRKAKKNRRRRMTSVMAVTKGES